MTWRRIRDNVATHPGSSQMVPGCWARGKNRRTKCELLQISRTSGDPHLSPACNHIVEPRGTRDAQPYDVLSPSYIIRSRMPRICDDGCIGRGHRLRQLAPLTTLGARKHCRGTATVTGVCGRKAWGWLGWLLVDLAGYSIHFRMADHNMMEMTCCGPVSARRDL